VIRLVHSLASRFALLPALAVALLLSGCEGDEERHTTSTIPSPAATEVDFDDSVGELCRESEVADLEPGVGDQSAAAVDRSLQGLVVGIDDLYEETNNAYPPGSPERTGPVEARLEELIRFRDATRIALKHAAALRSGEGSSQQELIRLELKLRRAEQEMRTAGAALHDDCEFFT
jgi:hypothetical protein